MQYDFHNLALAVTLAAKASVSHHYFKRKTMVYTPDVYAPHALFVYGFDSESTP